MLTQTRASRNQALHARFVHIAIQILDLRTEFDRFR